MLSKEDNERLTRAGPGTPMGKVFRRYWLPALLSSELPEADGAPVRVRLLNEDLVAFRDTNGEVGLVDAYCPHRRAPMFLGRNEKCGLRCVYHGWKFDSRGKCLEMPTEPKDSTYKDKIRIKSYPVWEGGGMVWAYMGPHADMPPPPDMELIRAPANPSLRVADGAGLQLSAGAGRRARFRARHHPAQCHHRRSVMARRLRTHHAAARS